jgi:hypothetical protein
MSDDVRIRRTKFNVEWVYAKVCYDALRAGQPVPEPPKYEVFEHKPKHKPKLIGKEPIEPMKVTCNGVTVYG